VIGMLRDFRSARAPGHPEILGGMRIAQIRSAALENDTS